ncbi:MAG TPA: hypothetical protein VNN80_26985 [Polyangiaceae bacterium]|nr:hypothetical protein [Polyangiaceae bacterium]
MESSSIEFGRRSNNPVHRGTDCSRGVLSNDVGGLQALEEIG